ncbi:MAG: SulP family inorganic anion transporter [Sulfuricurvum sp.]|nr:SulP family inorganic anion transporter [Sulfuricurvum sp.]MDP3023656.1 SulP family inorganic anion transporter [Sulfuricurvum sp.]MDP3118991.1 SulP family inorganic anion transporter [Sulfuricurvum sp.]
MTIPIVLKSKSILGDFWAGLAAMLVALPAAIAFGVTIYAPLGGYYAAYGAIAGILGVIAVGIIASILGGTDRLISAPSAPAAAVLSAFALEYMIRGVNPNTIFIMLMVVALLAGILQITFGAVGLGRLIKYMPFPVVSGYLSGIGLYIIASQSPKFLGMPAETHFWDSLQNPLLWQWQSVTVGSVTIMAMLFAGKLFRTVPAVIIALTAGISSYFFIGLVDSSLLQINSPFIIGKLSNGDGIDLFTALAQRFKNLSDLSFDNISQLFFPALTLAALLSIDTLKTCIVLDSMTHSFHNPNKELIAQGAGNITSALIGGMPGSGTMGPTMVNFSSGASSPVSGFVEGILGILAFLILGSLIAWIPIASLAGILIVIGFRMIDKHSVQLIKTRKTSLDFLIIVAVALTAVSVSLIAASGVGLILAVILYIAQQIRTSVVYRHFDGLEIQSKLIRNQDETDLLLEKGSEFSVYELHGSLFFGTANQLYAMLQEDLKTKKYIIIDMKRVQTVDLTAAHILLQIKDMLHEKDGYLILSRLPHKLPTGDDLESYFNQVGLLKHLSPIKLFDDLDDAVEWAENKIIQESMLEKKEEELLELHDFDLFKERKEDTIEEIQSLVESRSFQKGDVIYTQGDPRGEIFLIRRGLVRIMLPGENRKSVHLSTIGQNNFFGEFSFLEGSPHYTDVIAATNTDLYVISRKAFNLFSEHHKKASFHFMQSLATELANRLRLTRSELGAEVDV